MKTALLVASILLPLASQAYADTPQETRDALQNIRGISATKGKEETDKANQTLDAAWKALLKDKAGSLPIVRSQYQGELAQAKPNPFFLLDAGYFLYSQGEATDKPLAMKGLFAVDAAAPVIRQNANELFQFTYLAAVDNQPGISAFIDKTFLTGTAHAYVPQHALDLDPTLQCVFLYGVLGQDSEKHLDDLLSSGVQTQRVLEVLNWLGSAQSVPVVVRELQTGLDKDEFERVVGLLMRVGGPAGQRALLAVDASKLPPDARKEFKQVMPELQKQNYAVLMQGLETLGPGEKLTDSAMRARLDAMYKNDGRDDTLAPATVLMSTLPSSELLNRMLAMRSRMLRRLSDEALDDVRVTDAILNALQYEQAP